MAKKKRTRRYPVDVIAQREIASRHENGQTSTLNEYTVRISKATRIKMIEDNTDTYETIAQTRGRKAADKMAEKLSLSRLMC